MGYQVECIGFGHSGPCLEKLMLGKFELWQSIPKTRSEQVKAAEISENPNSSKLIKDKTIVAQPNVAIIVLSMT